MAPAARPGDAARRVGFRHGGLPRPASPGRARPCRGIDRRQGCRGRARGGRPPAARGGRAPGRGGRKTCRAAGPDRRARDRRPRARLRAAPLCRPRHAGHAGLPVQGTHCAGRGPDAGAEGSRGAASQAPGGRTHGPARLEHARPHLHAARPVRQGRAGLRKGAGPRRWQRGADGRARRGAGPGGQGHRDARGAAGLRGGAEERAAQPARVVLPRYRRRTGRKAAGGARPLEDAARQRAAERSLGQGGARSCGPDGDRARPRPRDSAARPRQRARRPATWPPHSRCRPRTARR